MAFSKRGIVIPVDEGSGDAVIPVSSGVNEGLDYTERFYVEAQGITTYFDVVKRGRRELFQFVNGDIFLTADFDTFNVRKE